MSTGEEELEVEEVPFGLPQPRFSPGILIAIPLFVAYEWGLTAAGDTVGRNSAEMLLSAGLRVFGERADVARWSAVGLLCAVAWFRVRRLEVDLGRAFLRTLAQGFVAALVLGPVLIGLVSLLDASPLPGDPSGGGVAPAPTLAQASRVCGAAIWEELLYRVVCYSLCYLLVVRLAAFFTRPGTVWHLLGDLVAILGSSLAFAALHLQAITRPLGIGGEAYDGGVFLWRLLAGILLAGLYRWRGLGVAAWAHGLFNLALFLGADPRVFRATP